MVWSRKGLQGQRKYLCHLYPKKKVPKIKPGINSLPMLDRPWRMISIDFTVKLPEVVVVDRYSKMGHLLHLKGTPFAMKTVWVFIREIVRLHGIPANIFSNWGVQFTSRFWKALFGTFDTYGLHPSYLILFLSPRFQPSKTLLFLFTHNKKLCQEAGIKAQVDNKRAFDKRREIKFG